MNITSFYLPGNNLGIEVPRIERPLTAEDLTAISGYLEKVTNNPANTEDLDYQLANRYDYAYSEYHYPYDETRWETSFDRTMAILERNKRRIIEDFYKQHNRSVTFNTKLEQSLESLRKTHNMLIKTHETLKSTNKTATEINETLKSTNKMAIKTNEMIIQTNEKLEKYHEEMLIMDRIIKMGNELYLLRTDNTHRDLTI